MLLAAQIQSDVLDTNPTNGQNVKMTAEVRVGKLLVR